MGKMMPSTEITDVAIELTALITSNLDFHLKSLDALVKLYSRLTTSAKEVGSTSVMLESLLQNQKASARKNRDEDPVPMYILLLEAMVDIVKGRDGLKTRNVADNDAVVHRQETLVAVSEDSNETACEAVASLERDTTQKDNAIDLQASILGGDTIERTAQIDVTSKKSIALEEPGVHCLMESTWSIYAGRFSTKKIWVNSNVFAEPNSNNVEDQTDPVMLINETVPVSLTDAVNADVHFKTPLTELEDKLHATGSVPSTEKPLNSDAIMDSNETLSASATALEKKDGISMDRFETCDANEANVAEDRKTSTPNVASSIAQSSESLVENVIADGQRRLTSYSGDIACDVSDGANAQVYAGEDAGLFKSDLSDTDLDAENAKDVEDLKPTAAAFDEECSTDMTGNANEHVEDSTSTVAGATGVTKGVQANFNQETNFDAMDGVNDEPISNIDVNEDNDQKVDGEAKEESGISELERDAIVELGANDSVDALGRGEMRVEDDNARDEGLTRSVMESSNDSAVQAGGESPAGDEDKNTLKANSEVSAKSIASPSKAIKTTRIPMERDILDKAASKKSIKNKTKHSEVLEEDEFSLQALIAQREKRKGYNDIVEVVAVASRKQRKMDKKKEEKAVLGEADSFSIEAMVEMSAKRQSFENEEKVIPTPSQKKKGHRSIPQEDDSSLEFLVQQRMSRSKYDPIDAIGRPKRVYEDGGFARVSALSEGQKRRQRKREKEATAMVDV